MSERRTHRTFVSYIDKSREYYAAQGYDKPYGWAHFKEVPFTPLPKPLAQCRIGVVTTADLQARAGPRSSKLFVAPNAAGSGLFTEKSWDRESTHTDDPETYLPIARLREQAERGCIGSLSPRFYGVPTDYSQRLTMEQDAPQVAAWQSRTASMPSFWSLLTRVPQTVSLVARHLESVGMPTVIIRSLEHCEGAVCRGAVRRFSAQQSLWQTLGRHNAERYRLGRARAARQGVGAAYHGAATGGVGSTRRSALARSLHARRR
jgi:hypothetical protein